MSERQKLFASISGSVIGHLLLLIGVFFALTLDWVSEPSARAKEKAPGPKEVTVMLSDLMAQIESPPVSDEERKVQQKRFLNTDGNTESESKPENARFESDRNTVAASRLRPDETLPQSEGLTMQGDERVSSLELQNRRFSKIRMENSQSAAADMTKASEEKFFTDVNTRSSAQAKASRTAVSANGDPVEQRKNKVNGTLSNKGEDAVDAVATPLGRYKKEVTDAVAEKWHKYRKDSAEPVTWGTLRLKFTINSEGKIMNLNVTENDGNEVLLELTLKAISEAGFEPMSDEVAAQLGAAGLAMKYDVIIY